MTSLVWSTFLFFSLLRPAWPNHHAVNRSSPFVIFLLPCYPNHFFCCVSQTAAEKRGPGRRWRRDLKVSWKRGYCAATCHAAKHTKNKRTGISDLEPLKQPNEPGRNEIKAQRWRQDVAPCGAAHGLVSLWRLFFLAFPSPWPSKVPLFRQYLDIFHQIQSGSSTDVANSSRKLVTYTVARLSTCRFLAM